MASDKNSPRKGQGNNQPNDKQSSETDAANVDWMIISDISTRIGGSPQPKEQSSQEHNNLSATSSSQASSNMIDEDLEDLEWLRSLDLDDAIERSPSPKPNLSNQNSNDVENIDWLIVTDLKTRMNDSEIRVRVNPVYQDIAQPNTTLQSPSVTDNLTNNPDNIDDNLGLDDLDLGDLDLGDLGLDGLDFHENSDFSDFSDLDALNFDTTDDFNFNELLSEVDDSEDKLQGLAEFLDDNFDSSDDVNDNNWDEISEVSEIVSDRFSEQSNLNIVDQSLETPIQSSAIAIDVKEDYEDSDLVTNQLLEARYQGAVVDDLELLNELQTDGIVDDFAISDQSQNISRNDQDAFNVETSDLAEEFVNELDDGFGEAQLLESADLNASEDEIWSSSSSIESELSNQSIDDPFANNFNNWEQSAEDTTDDAIWDSPSSFDADARSSTSIDNAFGTSDDWAIAPPAEQLDSSGNVNPEFPSDEMIDQTFDVGIDIASKSTFEHTNTQLIFEESEESLDEDFDVNDDLNYEGLAIADNLIKSIDESDGINFENVNFEDAQAYEDFDNISSNLDNAQNSSERQQFGELSSSPIAPLSEWENFSESFADQIPDEQIVNLEFADDFASYGTEPVDANLNTQVRSDWDQPDVPISDSFDDLESIIDESFDIDSFEEDSFLEEHLSNGISENIATTLIQNRVTTISEDTFTSRSTPPPISPPNFVNDLTSTRDPFEEDFVNDLLPDANMPEAIVSEEAVENDLLNRYASESDSLDNFISERDIHLPLSANLAASSNFDIGRSDRSDQDFLDEFDLDSIDIELTGDGFDSSLSSSKISTGLNPPSPPLAPVASITPSVPQPEPTLSTINNLPSPPPFLPPLPPKRSHSQNKTASSQPPITNSGFQSPPQKIVAEKIEVDDFDDFHAQQTQNKNQKSISSIDEDWSELLDADTVLSGSLRSPTESSNTNISAVPPTIGSSAGSSAGLNAGSIRERTSQGKEQTSSQPSNRKQTSLDDFSDLGLEIHNDDDWSGLLNSGNLPDDSLTSISTQLPSQERSRQNTSSRLDGTSISETSKMPRDRRNPTSSFGDATQARMSAPPDQMDFNRFTEEGYGSTYEPSTSPEVASGKPSKSKMTLPNISLESLWQDYLKIPAIGLGAIGGAVLLYALFNRSVFDLGLRWGIFKDASGKDFTNADFKGAKLDKVDFSKSILTGAKMQDASLVGANFQEANLDGVNFTKANLSGARLIQSSVIWAEFQSAQMILTDLAGANLTRSSFNNAKMEGANLKGTKIGAQGTEEATKFSATTLLAWQIVNESREGRNLIDQNLSGLNLSFSNLKRANLSNAKLNYTDMTEADLSGANLTKGQINGVNWSGAKLNGINLTDVVFEKGKLPKTDEETVCPNSKKGPCKF